MRRLATPSTVLALGLVIVLGSSGVPARAGCGTRLADHIPRGDHWLVLTLDGSVPGTSHSDPPREPADAPCFGPTCRAPVDRSASAETTPWTPIDPCASTAPSDSHDPRPARRLSPAPAAPYFAPQSDRHERPPRP
jgi:hypothetical protein